MDSNALSAIATTKILVNRQRRRKGLKVAVAVRIRPISETEVAQGCSEIITTVEENMVCMLDPSDNDTNILRANRSREKTFVFDHVFGPFSSQKQVYNQTTKALVESVLEGYNATIFAYGPTGAGKTFTMLGTDVEPGIMVLTLNYLYQEMHRTRHDLLYKVKMSYLEIYNEMVRDLLNPSCDFLDIREDQKGVQVAGLTEYEPHTTAEIMDLLSRGNKERMCEPTAVNKTSSRSHAVLQVTVEQRSRVRDISDEVKVAKLFMIDLAGSERAAQTQNTGKRLIEGAHINRSLLALGNCINALSEKGVKAGTYINYRDSKLTRLLKDSLGGNCKTVMITHVSPASLSFEESRNTLAYADRAKSIKVKPKRNQYNVNYHVAQYQNIISDLRQEIIRLKTQLVDADHVHKSSAKSFTVRTQSANVMEKLKEEMKAGFQEQLEIRKELIDLEDTALHYAVEYQRYQLIIEKWEQNEATRRAFEIGVKYRKQKNLTETIRAFQLNRHDTFRIDGGTKVLVNDSLEEPSDVKNARDELQNILKTLKDIENQKKELNEKLEECKKESEYLGESLQVKITNEEKRELLESLCKVHEFQIKNIELETVALMSEYLLKQKDIALQRNQMKNDLVDEIISKQRRLIRENQLKYPLDLDRLYHIYRDRLARDNEAMPELTIDVKKIGSKALTLPSIANGNSLNNSTTSLRSQTTDVFSPTKKAKDRFQESNSSDQESISKFALTRNPFPSTVYENREEQVNNNKMVKNYSKRYNALNQKTMTKRYERKGTEKIDTVQSLTEAELQLKRNGLTIRNLRRLNGETDDDSTFSLTTIGRRMDETQDDELKERKRSASAGLVREKQMLKAQPTNNGKKKTKTHQRQISKERPSWNNNFNAKAKLNDGNEIVAARQPGVLHYPNQKIKQYSQTEKTKKSSHESNPPTFRIYRNDHYDIMKYGRSTNDLLSINGTSFVARPSQPGFGRM